MVENNNTQSFKSSGNLIVDQVGQMGITGNIVNPNWNYYDSWSHIKHKYTNGKEIK